MYDKVIELLEAELENIQTDLNAEHETLDGLRDSMSDIQEMICDHDVQVTAIKSAIEKLKSLGRHG